MSSPVDKSQSRKVYLKTNHNQHTATPNLWGPVKAVLRGKFIASQACLRKQGKSQINTVTLHQKEPEKQQQTKPKVEERK